MIGVAENYKIGDRVMLVRTTDEHTHLEPGALGTVSLVDDWGTVHIAWDDGSRLGMNHELGDVIKAVGNGRHR